MWIPYDIRSSLKAESNPEAVRLSRADGRRRDFVVGFCLRNPITQSWELDMVADAEPQQIPAGPDLPEARISIYGNEAGKLGEVIYQLPASSAEEALDRSHADFQLRLMRYLAEIGRGMAIGGWRIADMAHGARWRCTPFRPSAMKVDFQALAPADRDLAPFIELFQRARNAFDAASRLLAGYAVLHAAHGGHPALRRSGAETLRVTQEMLVHSGALAWPQPLLDLELGQLLSLMRPHHDRLIQGGVLAPVLDDLAGQRRLAQLANLSDLIAHRLICAEIRARGRDPSRAEALAVMARGLRAAGPAEAGLGA
ncbi:methylamine utilization protein MauJ [Paracoccus siganidrum]|uniref:methylamine utilization protein MauJ n=2 Tax=Paracoccus siganidrum TaxID=1276757 RepID=UPI000F03706C|nr:methylamine utilization protein MauJ [Paracoccus siganidrum]RMC39588.1 methylamine utilization protein MauJ [Paracoccus siganidrum]